MVLLFRILDTEQTQPPMQISTQGLYSVGPPELGASALD